MPRRTDAVIEDTSSLERAPQRKRQSSPDTAPSTNRKSANVGRQSGTRGADPDPTENVRRRDRGPAIQDQTSPASLPAKADRALPASPGDSGSAPKSEAMGDAGGVDAPELPRIVEAQLHSVRRFVAGDIIAERFVVVDALPASGMGQIYKALDRQRDATDALSPYVALKFGHPLTSEDEACRSPIRREFEVLSRLSHPNIVKAFEIGTHGGAEFIVMEWLEGESLLHTIEQQTCKRMALRRAREIVRDVASGLACAHEKGIVHGDVKPSNILIVRSGAAKLLDFGAVSTMSEESQPQSWATRAYASVEVLEGRPATQRDDIFSLGVTAYLLLSGERPFGSRDAVEAQKEHYQPQPLPQDASDLWPAIKAALSFDAAQRPADAARFLCEFLQLPLRQRDSRDSTRKPFLRYAAIAAVVVALAVAWDMRLDNMGGIDIQANLRKAELALAAGHFVGPPGESALSYFNEVLSVAPDNAEALRGVDTVAGEFLARAANSLAIDDLEAARLNLVVAKGLSPDHGTLPIVERLFGKHANDLIATAALRADRNPAGAARILDQAERLIGSETDRIAEIRKRIADVLADLELRALLAGIDERILAERLVVPSGDSAIDLLTRAREIRPEDERISLAANRIVSALLFQALFAISEGNLDKAEVFLLAARSLGVRHLATARAVYELAKARDRVAAQAYERVLRRSRDDAALAGDAPGPENPVDD